MPRKKADPDGTAPPPKARSRKKKEATTPACSDSIKMEPNGGGLNAPGMMGFDQMCGVGPHGNLQPVPSQHNGGIHVNMGMMSGGPMDDSQQVGGQLGPNGSMAPYGDYASYYHHGGPQPHPGMPPIGNPPIPPMFGGMQHHQQQMHSQQQQHGGPPIQQQQQPGPHAPQHFSEPEPLINMVGPPGFPPYQPGMGGSTSQNGPPGGQPGVHQLIR